MKIAKLFSGIFTVLGAVLMLAALVLSLVSLKAAPKLVRVPQGAVDQSQALLDAIAKGDFDAAGRTMYGQPELSGEPEAEDAAGQKIWEAFVNSLSCEFRGGCYATDTGLARDAVITALDISSVADAVGEHAYALLTQRVESAEDMSELYDEENNFRQNLVDAVLLEAVDQAIREDGQTAAYEVTLSLIQRDGQWWVVPDQALLQAISGGLTRR
ncbi:MAG: hypothetical protein ACI4PH_00955 [Faecousia sp.]